MVVCKICNREFKNRKCLGSHLCKSHKEITTKIYYDKYFLKNGENRCKNKNCNNEPFFIGLNDGYKKSYCSYSCARSSKDVNDKQKITCLKLYGNLNFRNIEKSKKTCTEKYGKENSLSKGTIGYIKKNKTVKEKYGVNNIFSHPDTIIKLRKTWEENGHWISLDNIRGFKDYYQFVKRLTKKNSKKMFENWDGYDYYDKEYIKDNLFLFKNNDNNYPSIDHKISVKECFINDISPHICSNIENLCITKRIINILKSDMNSENFVKKLLQTNPI